ncbi:MAG: hypothetical protein QQN41_00005 [Nitrosopumilus sp.]
MFDDNIERLLWIKYKFFKAGISPREFRKCQMRDINDIMDIKNIVNEKAMRDQKIRDMTARMK